MECCKCISMKKAGRRSSMKSHFHGFGGLGGARCPVDVCPAPTEAQRRPQACLQRGFVLLRHRAFSPNRGFSRDSGGEQR